MSFFIEEERFIESNILKYDERLQSPITRFLEQTPTFVTYYHINNYESTADEGFKDAESIIGDRSPLRFQKIESLPIYGLEQIIARLEDGEAGLDVSYDGEATILPNTIKPLPNDFFVIPYLKDQYLFRLTGIEYDNIRPDNFYKITFKLDANDGEKRESIEKQVHDKFTCIFSNIGTDNKCIIREDYKNRLEELDAMYNDMVSLYLSLFYNERYNVLIGESNAGELIYDPYMTIFINQNQLFKQKNSLKTIMLEEDHIMDSKKKLKYERSIYRFVERRDVNLVKPFYYTTFRGSGHKESGFAAWLDDTVFVVDLPSTMNPENAHSILSTLAVETIRLNGPTSSEYMILLKKFIRNEPISIFTIPLTMNDELISLDANEEMFFITPILLYIIKETIREFNKTGIDALENNPEAIDEMKEYREDLRNEYDSSCR